MTTPNLFHNFHIEGLCSSGPGDNRNFCSYSYVNRKWYAHCLGQRDPTLDRIDHNYKRPPCLNCLINAIEHLHNKHVIGASS